MQKPHFIPILFNNKNLEFKKAKTVILTDKIPCDFLLLILKPPAVAL